MTNIMDRDSYEECLKINQMCKIICQKVNNDDDKGYNDWLKVRLLCTDSTKKYFICFSKNTSHFVRMFNLRHVDILFGIK